MTEPTLTVAVLEFLKPVEARLCLQSIRRHLHVPYSLVLLDNGGGADYPWQLYKEGLCDVLISKRVGRGGGVGQTDLFRWADTDLTLFVQSDQVMTRDLDERSLSMFTDLLTNGPNAPVLGCRYHCIDLNGDQSGRGVWTDRAHLIRTSLFNSLAPFPNGGPGPLHHLPWNERYLQDQFAARGWRIAHMGQAPGTPPMFTDRGMWTVRECAGGLLHMRTDTKALWWVTPPTEPYVFPEMTPAEWDLAIGGGWVGGTIPTAYTARAGGSFNCWGDVAPPTL